MLSLMRVQLLGKELLSPLNEVFSIVRAEESRRLVMLEPRLAEGSALFSTKTVDSGNKQIGMVKGNLEIRNN